MTRTRLVSALLIAAAAALSAAGADADAAARKPSCAAAKSKTVAQNASARVFKITRSSGTTRLYGCLRSSGRRVVLAQAADDIETSTGFDRVRLNGRFVAWQGTATDLSCKADCPPGYDPYTWTIERVDLRSRKGRAFSGRAAGQALVVSRKGAVAWVQSTGADTYDVRAGDAAGARTLDSGAIDPKSLKLAGSTLSWTNAGAPKTAALP
jgi:hypothetical protein